MNVNLMRVKGLPLGIPVPTMGRKAKKAKKAKKEEAKK